MTQEGRTAQSDPSGRSLWCLWGWGGGRSGEEAREILGSHLDAWNQKHVLGAGAGDLCSNKPYRGFWGTLSLRTSVVFTGESLKCLELASLGMDNLVK